MIRLTSRSPHVQLPVPRILTHSSTGVWDFGASLRDSSSQLTELWKSRQECVHVAGLFIPNYGLVRGVTVRLRKGTLLSLSEQELVDCVTTCNKCSGGWPASAFQWVISNRGIATEAYYPYSGTNGYCNGNLVSYRAASITGYVNVPQYNEMALMYAVAMQPVSVALEATSTSFQFYKGGIYSGPCGNTLNHAVTIIGYGVASNGMKYWIIKNSWGSTWGVGGYMYIQKEVYNLPSGLCGLAMAPSYPIASPYASA
ncbi:hypothetical protein LUZ61_000350 [Rhynchospora tenuis]|uniref:Peptidase C1A papain C-terminal domain-containing protein n=1 Tax=Rhynchospora tenuis TaxID=198213 RepID=A0AAD5ZF45_9POAL|nr:hypothetical protein LUZ61_000350 [Rhynchospora tenuis]